MKIACVHIPAFPLQLLLHQNPEWRSHPAVVVEHDLPQSRILHVNEKARKKGVLAGMTYAAGLSLARGMRAGIVSDEDIEGGVEQIVTLLKDFSPEVEPAAQQAMQRQKLARKRRNEMGLAEGAEGAGEGAFWVNAGGLSGIYPSLERWAAEVRARLRNEGFYCSVAVGHRRFSSYAIATCLGGRFLVLNDPEEELVKMQQVPITRLELEPELRDALLRLGIENVGQFLALPERGLLERFGRRAAALHRLAAGEAGVPLRPVAELEPVAVCQQLQFPVRNATRLLFIIKGLLPTLLNRLVERGQALAALHIEFQLERAESCAVRIAPAEATLDDVQIIDLVRLKLESVELEACVEEMVISADGADASRDQLGLFAEQPRRDLDAANRALARVRAELGDGAVMHAELCEGHLPEASYQWSPLKRLSPPQPRDVAEPMMIRAILPRPIPITSPSRYVLRNDGWTIASPKLGSVVRSIGPYVISGGWWHREVHRSYHFVETQRGDILWVYLDRQRRRWFLQGIVK